MYWLSRPPFVRTTLAWLIIVAGVAVELWPAATIEHPFAIRRIAPGTEVDVDDIEMRLVPEGLLARIELPVVASQWIEAGDPVLAGRPPPVIPEEWWAVELPVSTAEVGTAVRVVITDYDRDPVSTEGVVVQPGADDFGVPTALVAVPPAWADTVAAAAREDRVTVLVGR